jgi:aspartate/methionine/tyrosine aminotransferase
MVPPIEYIDWIEGRLDAVEHDLGGSDLRAVAGEWGVVPEVLADRPDPADDVTLEAQLAEVYDVPEDHVLVTPGATGANLAAAGAALADDPCADTEEDDDPVDGTVLVEAPGYEPMYATPEWLGATVHRFRRPAEEDYALDPERVQAGVTEDTCLVSVTNRHNPSGCRVDRETLAAAADAAGEADARLLVDEVYAPLGGDGDGPFGGPTAAGLDNAVVSGSLTKFFGLGGLRVGWLVGDPAFLERAATLHQHVARVPVPSRALARRALHHREALVARAGGVAAENAGRLTEFVADRPDLAGPVYDGCTYAFPAHDSADGDEVAAAAEERDLLVVPGRFFGDGDRFRVSLGREPAAMDAALDALGATLDDL